MNTYVDVTNKNMTTKKVFEISYAVEREDNETLTNNALIAAETMSKAVEFAEYNFGPVLYCNVVCNGAPVTIV